MNEKIGIFGGSFNPIHLAHLRMARQVIERFDLGRMMLLPANIPPHKTPDDLASSEDRLAMCRLAIEDQTRMEISDLEIRRQGPS